jgi:tRNA 2-thiocytidine biosynthesis protein TtcA
MNTLLPLASPPWTQLGKKIESKIRKALFTYAMIPDNGPLALALSGGKDSLTLLFQLKAILGRGLPDIPIHALHVSGTFSCGPSMTSNFLKKICHTLKVPLLIKHAEQNKEALNCYSCSRQRRSLLFEAAHEIGAKTIAMGHHKDDSLQTLLMNVCHKAEFEELPPSIEMYDYGIKIIRPLIYVKEQEISSFAELYHFRRITCQCPIGQNSQRKKTENLLNEMEKLFPNVRDNLFQAGQKYSSQKALKKRG